MVVDVPGYKIVSEIGKGGMATVYVAIQESFNRKVALKVMASSLTGDPVFAERFLREARILASLSHRNIVAVYDLGKHGAYPYFSMEFLPGGDLKHRLRSGIRADKAIRIIYDMAVALAYAHSKSYIHRDIKPENMLFRADGSVVLTDFGIAKALEADTNVTSVGVVVGSPHYMSPEQALAKKVDTRADIYSLGVVMYEVLVGRPLYNAGSSVAAAIKHISDPIPKLPAKLACLQGVLEKMVAKHPSDRYSTMVEVAQALEPFVQSPFEEWANGGNARPSRNMNRDHILFEKLPTITDFDISLGDRIETPIPTAISKRNSPSAPTMYVKPTLLGKLRIRVYRALANLGPSENETVRIKLAFMATVFAMVGGAVIYALDDGSLADKTALQMKAQEFLGGIKEEMAKEVAKVSSPATTAVATPAAVAEPNLASNVVARGSLANEPQAQDAVAVADKAVSSQNSDPEPIEADFNLDAEVLAFPTAQEDNQEDNQALAEQNSQDANPAAEASVANLQPVAANSVPAPTAEDSPEVYDLMNEARKAMWAADWVKPAGSSALDYYEGVLRIQRNHPGALSGIDTIARNLLSLASRELNNDNLSAAYDNVQQVKNLSQQYYLPGDVTKQANEMNETIARIEYLETMNNIERWVSILESSDFLTVDDLNQAYTAYMAVVDANIKDEKLRVANGVYSDAFYELGKKYFKRNQMEMSRDLIAKGLQINPQHEQLKDLSQRWARRNNNDDYFLDKLY